MRQIKINIAFDMRAPHWATPAVQLYPAAIEMAAFADRIGASSIGLMEHHGSEDGYLPQPFSLCAAMSAVTKTIEFSLSAVILPLHDPVIVAEQIAIADLLSNGRVRVILGAGYVPSEFAMFEKNLHDRARLMDRGVEIILRALKGERFEIDGRPVFIRPLPQRPPEDIILIGGAVPASARRAARFDVGFGPMRAAVIDDYLAECRKLGRAPRHYNVPKEGMPMAVHLCEDPDEGWKVIEPHAIHVITEYAKWAEAEGAGSNSPFKGLTEPAALRGAGLFAAWTPEQLLAKIPEMQDHQSISLQPLLGGLDPAEGWKSLKLLEQVMPEVKQAIAALD